MLTRLGYRIVMPEAFAELRRETPRLEPDLLVVDERQLAEAVAEDAASGAPTPILLLSGREGATGADPRIVGAVKRPAGLHELYRLIQQIFEDTPRTTPRVATQLRARCASNGEKWEGRVLSLSENGCLLRTTEAIRLGEMVELEFRVAAGGNDRARCGSDLPTPAGYGARVPRRRAREPRSTRSLRRADDPERLNPADRGGRPGLGRQVLDARQIASIDASSVRLNSSSDCWAESPSVSAREKLAIMPSFCASRRLASSLE